MKKHFASANILLPDFNKIDGGRWAAVACDQYTSEPQYWEGAADVVGDSPSTLKIILPEVYLSETEERVPRINAEMEKYLKEVLVSHPDSMIYLERTQRDGVVRRGIVGLIDLEDYDYSRGSESLIRATEGTVLSRIPPRVKIRRDAPIELPHVMLLVDDPEKTVIEPLMGKGELDVAYDFDLMCGGGHVKGFFLPETEQNRINEALTNLITPEKMAERYGENSFAPLLFAVGDGNHSLATAKACYTELKEKLGDEEAKRSPARYALCEVVNLHDDALQFEPIYRVVFNVDPIDVINELRKYAETLKGDAPAQKLTMVSRIFDSEYEIPHPEAQLTVGTLQNFLDRYVEAHPEAEVDYIHGEESLISLARGENALGFIFDGMEKSQLFKTVLCDGALPRKTFSMGHAHDKRYYLECRGIK